MEDREGLVPDEAVTTDELRQDVQTEQSAVAPPELEEDERAKRERLIRRYVENRVLALDPTFEGEDLSDAFTELTSREKADLLYEKLMARYNALQEIHQETQENPEAEVDPVDPYLISEIKALWGDSEVQNLFVEQYTQARIDAKLYRLSELGQRWEGINHVIAEKQQEFEAVTQRLFLRQAKREDQLSAARGKAQRLARELIKLREERDFIVTLKEKDADGKEIELPSVPENTDIAATIHYQELREYHNQAKEGFVWLPSREEIHHKTIAALQNGRWPVLIGEAGTGKSEQADAAAVVLTGEEPTHIACSERTNERDLIADKEIDPTTGGSYDEYGPVMRAATGFDDSRQADPSHSAGRIVRFDESGRLGSQGYAIIKELRQKKPGDTLYGKEVKPGFASIWTTNPVGPRYPDRHEPDPALRRELAYIDVDYPPMTKDNPELYEFILATLMDNNGHIAVAGAELAPDYWHYKKGESQLQFRVFEQPLPDGREVIAVDSLNENDNDSRHGVAYRLAYAVRAVQDAFDAGNAGETSNSTLRMVTDPNGAIRVVPQGGEHLTLSTSTITLGEVASWMTGYAERKQKDDANFQTDTLTEWLHHKLHTYLGQCDAQDRGKIEAIFNHFKLFETPPAEFKTAKPLTPKEIGYLSPRVPRPLHLREPQPAPGEESEPVVTETETVPVPEKLLETHLVMLEDGTEVHIRREPTAVGRDNKIYSLYPGSSFTLASESVNFAGRVDEPDSPYNADFVVRIHTGRRDEALHRIVTIQEITEQGDNFWPYEKLSQETLETQYVTKVDVLRKAGVLERLRDGSEGIKGIDGREYPVPALEKVLELVQEKYEVLSAKIEQGFAVIHLTPFATSLGDRKEISGGNEYSGLMAAYAKELRRHFKAGTLKLADGTPVTNFNEDDPLWAWDRFNKVDEKGQIVYDIKAFDADPKIHGGKTKSDILKESSSTPGWRINLIEDLPNIPRSRSGIEIGGRPQLEAGSSPREYLGFYIDPSEDNEYRNEVGWAPEDWFTYALHRLETTGQITDDYEGPGNISYLVNSYIPTDGDVPLAAWNRSRGQARLYGSGPGYQYELSGSRSAVRIS